MSTLTIKSQYIEYSEAIQKILEMIYEQAEKFVHELRQDKKKRDKLKNICTASLVFGAAFNLYAHHNIEKVEQSSVVRAPANIPPGIVHGVHSQMDSDFYPYPHIRVERGTPKVRKLDYGSSKYISQIAGGSSGRYLTIEVPGQKIGDGNFVRSLDQMYSRKKDTYGENIEVENLRQVTYSTYREARTYMTLGQRLRGVDQVVNESVAGISFPALCADRWINLSALKCQALRNISTRIDGKFLTSVQMTETFDKSTPGDTNAWVLDQMYRFQGREAVDAIPSLAGKIPVVGPFQITQQLVGESSIRPHSITVVSNHSRFELPLKVIDFKRTDHERGALYGFIYDTARLLQELDDSEVAVLEKAFINSNEDFVRFLAASHRGSGDAREFAKNWIHDGATNSYSVFEYTVADRDYPKYSATALKNYVGLQKYLRENFPQIK